MERSEQINEIAGALAKAQAKITSAEKDRTNPFFGSSYATLSSVWDACRAALSENGLSVMQPVHADGVKVTVRTLLAHSSGQWVTCDLIVLAKDPSPQAVGSAITYARRYGLASMVGVAPDEDDDGNGAQPTTEKRKLYSKPVPAPKEEDRNQATERDVATAKSKAKGLAASATLAARASKVWTDFKAKAPAGSNEQADGFRIWIKRILGTQKGSPEWTLDDVVKLEVALTANDLTPDERCDVGDGKK